MALTITKAVTESYDSTITDSNGGLAFLAALNNANPQAARLLGPKPFTFSAEGTSVGNEAVTLALLAPVNLTTLGVLFPASSLRQILCRVWSRRQTVAQCGYSERMYTVVGGATPTIDPDDTIAAALAATNDNRAAWRTANNNSAGAPEYGEGVVIMDAVATTNVIVGVQNILGTTNAAVTATSLRWRLEVLVLPLVGMPVAP